MDTRTIAALLLGLAGTFMVDEARAQQPPAPATRGVTLRFRYTAGQRHRLRSRTTQMMRGSDGAIVTTAEHEVETVRVRADGAAEQRLRVVSIELTGPGVPAGLRQSLTSALSGASIEFTQDTRGRVSERRVGGSVSSDMQPILDGVLESLDQMATQLPEAPVSPGATWTDRRPMRIALPGSGPLEMTMNTTYTLRRVSGAAEGETAVLGVAMTVSTAPGARIAGMRLMATGNSTGESTLALGRGTVSTSRSSGTMRMEMSSGQRPVTFDSRFEHSLSLADAATTAPRAAPAAPAPRARPRVAAQPTR